MAVNERTGLALAQGCSPELAGSPQDESVRLADLLPGCLCDGRLPRPSSRGQHHRLQRAALCYFAVASALVSRALRRMAALR